MTVPAQPASGRSIFMKKRSLLTLAVTTALLVSLTLAGCGGKTAGNSSESSTKEESAAETGVSTGAAEESAAASAAAESVSASSAAESVSASAAEESIPAGQFEGIGADPNNIYNGHFTLAFDDEYIYYLDHAYKRVPYEGGEAEAISEILDSDPHFVNSWNGDLYFLTVSGKVGTLLKIGRAHV